MSEEEITEEDAPKKKSKLPLIIGVVLALAGGGGGFFAVQSGMILGAGDETEMAEKVEEAEHPMDEIPDVVFIPLDPLMISLGPQSKYQYLRFAAQLEVDSAYQADVETVLPRVFDVLNGYLRAVDVADLEKPSSLIRLRSQMLRRIQTVVGRDRVNDLLVMEFVLN